jgi:integrase
MGRRTVADFVRGWLETIKPPVKRARTYQSYELLTRLHIEPTIGRIQLVKLDAQSIQVMLSAKLREGLLPMTVRHIRTVLRRALNVALKQRCISYNPATLIELPDPDRPEIRSLSEEQARQLLNAAKGSRLEALLVLALRLGLRRGELLGLQWSDIDLDGRQLNVVRMIQRIPGQPLAAAPLKTRGSRRNIPLPNEVVRTLRAHRVRQLQDRLAAGAVWSDQNLVFPDTIGKPLEPRAVDTLFKRLLKKANLPGSTRFHDCRHSAATFLLERGADLYEVSRLLGHSSITITADVYGHISQGMKRGLADRMDSILADA